jgi:PLP dependent protein
MSGIAENLNLLKSQIPLSVKLVAVSKTKPVSDIMAAYVTGQRIFGENRVQELIEKKDHLPNDIEWHLIGHLQRNKVKLVVPFIKMIQSVDTFRLLQNINSEAMKIDRTIDCLLQMHIATEETKFGFSYDEIDEMLNSSEYNELKHVRICGLMGIASFTDDNEQIKSEFSYLADCFRKLKNRYFVSVDWFSELSMGMSGDYKIAIENGSTIVRLGSIIFGTRK